MQLHYLPLKRARHHPLAQAFEAVHLGLHQTSAVIAAPLFPDAAPQSACQARRLLPGVSARPGRLPRLGACVGGSSYSPAHFAKQAPRHALCRRRRPQNFDAGTWPIGRRFAPALGQHGRIAHAVAGHLDGPDLQRVGIGHPENCATGAGTGTAKLAFPFALAKERTPLTSSSESVYCPVVVPARFLALKTHVAVGHPPVRSLPDAAGFQPCPGFDAGQTEQALRCPDRTGWLRRRRRLAPAFAAG